MPIAIVSHEGVVRKGKLAHLMAFVGLEKQEVAEELGDVFINLVQLSDKLGIDLLAAGVQKIAKIKVKYPAALSRGKALKYTTYCEDQR